MKKPTSAKSKLPDYGFMQSAIRGVGGAVAPQKEVVNKLTPKNKQNAFSAALKKKKKKY